MVKKYRKRAMRRSRRSRKFMKKRHSFKKTSYDGAYYAKLIETKTMYYTNLSGYM